MGDSCSCESDETMGNELGKGCSAAAGTPLRGSLAGPCPLTGSEPLGWISDTVLTLKPKYFLMYDVQEFLCRRYFF